MRRYPKWKPVPGFERLYFVSRDGQVWSSFTGKILSPRLDTSGYWVVTLWNGTRRDVGPRKISVLLLSAFVGPRPKGLQAAHLNGKRTDDRLDNLAWVTASENQRHRKLHGTHNYGEKLAAKLTDEKVRRIRVLRASGWLPTRLAKKFHVSVPTICNVCAGRKWKHVK